MAPPMPAVDGTHPSVEGLQASAGGATSPSASTAAASASIAAAAQLASTGPKRLHVSNIPFRFREADLRQLLGVSLFTLLE